MDIELICSIFGLITQIYMNNFIPERLSTLCDSIFEQAVNEAIEQHRLNGKAIAQSDSDGNVVIIQPEDIIPLAEKLQQREQEQLT
jgi:maltodextrin utilization protein YvdJ